MIGASAGEELILRNSNYDGITYNPVEAILPAPSPPTRFPVSARIKSLMKYLGPAFVVSVAYIDPGNFGTNICGGSKFNYDLLWVIFWSNLMAMFLQALSAKLGIACGRNLPQVCSEVFSRKVNWLFWFIAEIAAMATNLAEFLGGVLGLYLLLHIPLIYASLITAAATFFIASMEKYGQRWVEAIIVCLVGVISGAYVIELFLASPDWHAVGLHTLIPALPNSDALLIAAGMLGATVMPHVIFLHSQLVQFRNGFKTEAQRQRHYRMETIDIAVAMNIAFVVNAAMVIVSASVFFAQGLQVTSIEQAHQSLNPLLGSLSSAAFAIALLASGLSSSAVGTMAGETIMKGFVNLKIPPTIAKLANMVPALIIIGLGLNPMKALLLSQVVLSFALPAAIIPLLLITRRRDLMGVFANKPLINWVGWSITAIILILNASLLYQTISGLL